MASGDTGARAGRGRGLNSCQIERYGLLRDCRAGGADLRTAKARRAMEGRPLKRALGFGFAWRPEVARQIFWSAGVKSGAPG